MRHFRHLRSLAIVSAVAVVLTVLVVAGCSVDRSSPTAPERASAIGQTAAPAAVLGSAPANRPDVVATMAVQDRATPTLLGRPGVIGTGTSLDEQGRPVVLVLTDRQGVSGVPSEIEGVATRVQYVGRVVPYAKPGGGGTLQMGTSTGNDRECAAGTLGCVVTRGGTRYFLSNNHVFARENAAALGERIDAPGRYDGKPKCSQTAQCATLAAYKSISFGGSNTIDAALALPIASRAYTSAEAGGYTPVSTVVPASIGLACKKTGRTTRLTHATVQAINVTIQVQYSNGVATFTNQVQYPGTFINSGDSGSLAVTETGNNPVALLFAGGSGGSFGNPIGDVLSYFNATVTP
jgi:hypothetical protein